MTLSVIIVPLSPSGDGPHVVLKTVRATGGKGKRPAIPPEMVETCKPRTAAPGTP